jgi:flagellar basal-body rod modification protein FlgD
VSLAATVAQQSTAAASATSSSSSQTALSSLSSNFQGFLKLLMTQLQNQDPTSPLDTNQFTSQLVQFASVEQQINANTSLTELIKLTQSGQILQSAPIVGHQVEVSSDTLPLQGGTGSVHFNAASAGKVAIAIADANGRQIAGALVDAAQGANTWSWNGKSSGGATLPDGAYKVAVASADAQGTTTALPFTVVGTATGVQTEGSTVKLSLGTLAVDFSAIRSIVN